MTKKFEAKQQNNILLRQYKQKTQQIVWLGVDYFQIYWAALLVTHM